jgi:Zn-dependent M28 family amino/carboxypeptidase
LSAHYDSRSQADQDLNETNRSLPVPGANDGASGVAVLLELARHIPQMNLDYDVVLFLNDAEDQGNNYTLGAEAWADNLTESEINATHAFILLDMIGDADLQLHNIQPGNETLKSAIVEMGTALGMVEGEMACDGTLGTDIIQYDVAVGVIDDHIHPHNLGIPSIDLMDTAYGEPRMMTFGSYWHTMEDTPDKVSAESLEHVGRLVELGLRSDAFFELDSPEEPDPRDDTKDDTTEPDSSEAEHNGSPRLATLAGLALLAVAVLLAMIEFKGKA